MGFAIRTLGWRPWEFWRATPHEVWSAVEMIDDEVEAARSRD